MFRGTSGGKGGDHRRPRCQSSIRAQSGTAMPASAAAMNTQRNAQRNGINISSDFFDNIDSDGIGVLLIGSIALALKVGPSGLRLEDQPLNFRLQRGDVRAQRLSLRGESGLCFSSSRLETTTLGD